MKLDINSKDIEEVLESFDDDNVDFAEFVRSLIGYKLSEQYDEPIKLISVTFNEDNTIECNLSKISLDERLDNER